MDKKVIVKNFWKDVASQSASSLLKYFQENAIVNWNNTNEKFTVAEYIRANCEYPNKWNGEVERIEEIGNTVITVARVWQVPEGVSVHAVSFFQFNSSNKITLLNEYWGDDGIPPQWRIAKNIGKYIK